MPLTVPTPDELRAFRQAVGGWSQAKLAEELGASTRAIEEWEAGRRAPPPFLRLALAAMNANLTPWTTEAGGGT